MGAQESLIGKVGRVTVSIPAGGPGEVLLPVRGGSEAFAAWSDEPIARHSRVVVVIAANRLVEVLPALVEAAARGLAGSNLTILNGTQGVNEMVAGLVGQGLSILDALKNSASVTGTVTGAAGGTATGLPPATPEAGRVRAG